jgi:hypothetical protein
VEASVPLSQFKAQIGVLGNLFCAPRHIVRDDTLLLVDSLIRGIICSGVYISGGQGPTNTFALLAGMFGYRLLSSTGLGRM